MTEASTLALAATVLGGIGTAVGATARVALRAVRERVSQLEAEVRELRSLAAQRDALAIEHVVWDARVAAQLTSLGHDPGPPPPLIPPATKETKA